MREGLLQRIKDMRNEIERLEISSVELDDIGGELGCTAIRRAMETVITHATTAVRV